MATDTTRKLCALHMHLYNVYVHLHAYHYDITFHLHVHACTVYTPVAECVGNSLIFVAWSPGATSLCA